MSLFPAFDTEDRPPLAARLAPKLRALADEGVYIGTSSFRYPGWLKHIYSPQRYTTRGKFSKAKFDEQCLSEYALTFPTVCLDSTFYQFPSVDFWQRHFSATPPGFVTTCKVPEDITVFRWPRHPRYANRAGNRNETFLNADVFKGLFLERLAPYADRVGPLIFEFGTFGQADFRTVDEFLDRLDRFLEALPSGWRYSVEIRNPEYLGPGYFALLASHGVAHAFNAWTRMPELSTQIEMPGAYTADFAVVRALLPRGRTFEHQVQAYEPYELIREPAYAARDAMAQAIRRARRLRQFLWLVINNRLEGFAPGTVEAVLEQLQIF